MDILQPPCQRPVVWTKGLDTTSILMSMERPYQIGSVQLKYGTEAISNVFRSRHRVVPDPERRQLRNRKQ